MLQPATISLPGPEEIGGKHWRSCLNQRGAEGGRKKMLSNLKIGTRLIGSFLCVAVISLVIGAFGYFQIHKLDAADTMLYGLVSRICG
jgi:hypothetical protein